MKDREKSVRTNLIAGEISGSLNPEHSRAKSSELKWYRQAAARADGANLNDPMSIMQRSRS